MAFDWKKLLKALLVAVVGWLTSSVMPVPGVGGSTPPPVVRK